MPISSVSSTRTLGKQRWVVEHTIATLHPLDGQRRVAAHSRKAKAAEMFRRDLGPVTGALGNERTTLARLALVTGERRA
jgi:hypothetical protein